jgi:hypothetical protein
MKIFISVISILLFNITAFCNDSISIAEKALLERKIRKCLSDKYLLFSTESGFVIESKDSIGYYFGLSLSPDKHQNEYQRNKSPKSKFIFYIDFEPSITEEDQRKIIEKNDSIRRVLMPDSIEKICQCYFLDYRSWNDSQKRILSGYKHVANIVDPRYSVFLYDNRPSYFAGCIHPYDKEKEIKSMINSVLKRAFNIKNFNMNEVRNYYPYKWRQGRWYTNKIFE